MRTAKKTVPTLDLFRLAAVLLVVMNHTSPLADVSAMADFWLTRVLARVAVPFFLMTTGYFLSRNHWAGVGRQLKKLCLLYGVCILLYLPVNLYAGSFTGPADVLRKLLVDGTFYHLWYFPATILGIVIARWLSRLGLRVALPVAALLYLIGLGGDSYYGLVSQIPLLRTLYDGIFTLCGYTRNGLFFAPLFLLLGAAGRRWNQKLSLAGFFLSLAAMSAEGLWLHRMDVQRHDSMYLALPLCIRWPGSELPDMIPAKFISSPAMDFGTSQLSPVTMSGLESHSMEFEAMMRLFSEALTCGRFCLSGPEWPVSALCKPERAPGTGGSFRQSKKPNWRWSPSATRTVCPGICLSGAAKC